MFTNFMNFFLDLLNKIPGMFEWLVTPWAWLESISGLTIAPIYLLCGTAMIIAGVIRALT